MPRFPIANGTARDIPQRTMLISNPRTCSNLLVRVLNGDNQPNTKHGGYHFLEPMLEMTESGMHGTSCDEWTQEQKEKVWTTYEQGMYDIEKNVGLEKGKVGFDKEHVETILDPIAMSKHIHGTENTKPFPFHVKIEGYPAEFDSLNQTIFPDSYLLSWQPIFLIRNPIRAFESFFRSIQDIYNLPEQQHTPEASKKGLAKVNTTLFWTRNLWNFYTKHGIQPLLVDADDVVMHTKSIAEQLAQHIGFDRDVLQYDWKEASQEATERKPAAMKRMLDSLDASTGVQANPDKLAKDLRDPAEQMEKWVGMFGEEMAGDLLSRTQDAMPDYEWLYARRLMP